METPPILTYGYFPPIQFNESTSTDPIINTTTSTPGYSEDLITGNASDFLFPPTLSDEWTNKQVTLIIILGLLSIVTIIANSFVLYIFTSGKQKLRNPTNLLLANLAVADLLVGLVVMPILASATILDFKWIFGDFLCHSFDYCHFLLCGASMWSMIMIGVDRYIGVTRPLKYKNIITQNRTIFVIIFIWFAAASLTSGPLTYWPKEMSGIETLCYLNLEKHFLRFVIFFVYMIPITSTIFIYFLVYRNAVAPFNKNIKKMTIYKQNSVQFISAKSKQIRLAKSIALVTGTLFIFYTPVFAAFAVKAFFPAYFSLETLMLTGWIRYCCSTVNPFMYALAVPGYKQEIAERLFGIRKRGNKLNESITTSYATGSDESKRYDEEKPKHNEQTLKLVKSNIWVCSSMNKCHRQILCSSWMLPTTWGTASYFICPDCPTIRFFDGIQPCFCQNCNHKFTPSEFRPPQEKLATLTTIPLSHLNRLYNSPGNPQILVARRSQRQKHSTKVMLSRKPRQ
ncbi:Alpha-1A adrenergic receptor [Orchesella cincta]|uniref:Alpha-1A adrenergic receptor n=1 Tax=Orchesella cincta TaxID=48709 RepID=A0A1D2M3E8_ORCCI|nr:Alpha-1A adrenergic receptor [Orchesella cincta]